MLFIPLVGLEEEDGDGDGDGDNIMTGTVRLDDGDTLAGTALSLWLPVVKNFKARPSFRCIIRYSDNVFIYVGRRI